MTEVAHVDWLIGDVYYGCCPCCEEKCVEPNRHWLKCSECNQISGMFVTWSITEQI